MRRTAARLQLVLESRAAEAIERIREYEPPDGYYLGDSGGKDSTVLLDLAKRSGVRYDAHYNVSPIDPPEVRQFLKAHHPETQFDIHAKNFWGKPFESRGPPMRPPTGHRWCCELIKEAGGEGRVKLLGMRRQESGTRRDYPVHNIRCPLEHTEWVLPIVDWSEADVWCYLRERGLPVNPLYAEGFQRIGCVLCPFKGAAETQRDLVRFPKIAANWRAACYRYFDKRIERGTPLPWATAEEFWQWWLSRA